MYIVYTDYVTFILIIKGVVKGQTSDHSNNRTSNKRTSPYVISFFLLKKKKSRQSLGIEPRQSYMYVDVTPGSFIEIKHIP